MTLADLLAVASLISLAASGIAAGVSLQIRAQIATLRADLTERSETRREGCRQEFASKTEVHALSLRVDKLERRKAAEL